MSSFTDDRATCVVVGQDAGFMLLDRERFADFTSAPLSDPATRTEAIYAMTADSRGAVDELVDRALASGGSPAGQPQDHGFMFGRSFRDPDGHHFEVFWMDVEAAGPAAAADGAAAL